MQYRRYGQRDLEQQEHGNNHNQHDRRRIGIATRRRGIIDARVHRDVGRRDCRLVSDVLQWSALQVAPIQLGVHFVQFILVDGTEIDKQLLASVANFIFLLARSVQAIG